MSFQMEDVQEVDSVNQTLISLPPFLSLYYSIGDYKISASSYDNLYWLLCDGRSLLREEYPLLFNVIGTSFGSVDGDHFNLPDFRGRVPGIIGLGSGLTSRTIGTSTGAETVTLSTNQIPSHSHTGTTNSGEGTHIHGSNAVGGQGNLGLVIADGNNTVIDTDGSSGELNVWTTPRALTINNTDSAHIHTFTSNNTGGGESHNNMQPTLFCGNIFILYNLIN
jgi:microcystin-dependent protein